MDTLSLYELFLIERKKGLGTDCGVIDQGIYYLVAIVLKNQQTNKPPNSNHLLGTSILVITEVDEVHIVNSGENFSVLLSDFTFCPMLPRSQ